MGIPLIKMQKMHIKRKTQADLIYAPDMAHTSSA